MILNRFNQMEGIDMGTLEREKRKVWFPTEDQQSEHFRQQFENIRERVGSVAELDEDGEVPYSNEWEDVAFLTKFEDELLSAGVPEKEYESVRAQAEADRDRINEVLRTVQELDEEYRRHTGPSAEEVAEATSLSEEQVQNLYEEYGYLGQYDDYRGGGYGVYRDGLPEAVDL